MGFSGSISWDLFCHARCLLGIKTVKGRRWGPDWAEERGKCARQSQECFVHSGGALGWIMPSVVPGWNTMASPLGSYLTHISHIYQLPRKRHDPAMRSFFTKKNKKFSLEYMLINTLLNSWSGPLQTCSHLSHGGFFCFDDSICFSLPWHSAVSSTRVALWGSSGFPLSWPKTWNLFQAITWSNYRV